MSDFEDHTTSTENDSPSGAKSARSGASGEKGHLKSVGPRRGRRERVGMTLSRYFTSEGEDPFESVEWELRTAHIGNEKGETVFEQTDCEIPKSWSQLATNVVVSKYFRGHLGTPQRERSVKQLIGRVVGRLREWGAKGDYFATPADADTFASELTHLLVHQKLSFNSPVWFNLGIEGTPQQASACFINSVDDSMDSIMDLAKTEAMLFKGGSGAGSNLSKIRSSRETLKGGGIASGPVSFMKGFDAFAGVIKSGARPGARPRWSSSTWTTRRDGVHQQQVGRGAEGVDADRRRLRRGLQRARRRLRLGVLPEREPLRSRHRRLHARRGGRFPRGPPGPSSAVIPSRRSRRAT